MKNLPVVIGVFGVSGIVVLAFAVATGWIGGLTAPARDKEPEELEPLVAGIGMGAGGVPRWLYAAYVIIPLWALFYLVNNVQVKGEQVPEARKEPAAQAPVKPGAAGPAGGLVRIRAKNIAFDIKQIVLAAGAEAVVRFRNDDSAPHNVAIYKDAASAQAQTPALFQDPPFPGPRTKEYRFAAPPVGTYLFQCDVHPGMKGTVLVK